MLDNPMFSICVPVYNVEEYLGKCVESLLCQTERDFEVVLVDDGSTDGSGRICDGYANRFPGTVRVIHQKNRGVFYTRSVAFSVARGRYLLCVDSDDVLREDALERLRGVIELTGAQMVFFDWSRHRDFSRDRDGLGFCEDGKTVIVSQNDVFRLLFTTRKLNSMWTYTVAADCIDPSIPKQLGTDLRYGEDLYWNLSVFSSAATYAYVAEPLYYYRQNLSSATHSYSETRMRDISLVRAAVRRLATERCPDDALEEVLTAISSVDLMQIADLAQMVCLSDRGDKATLLNELKESDMYRQANDPSAMSLISRADYRLQLALLRKGRFRSLVLIVKILSWMYPIARNMRRLMKWA